MMPLTPSSSPASASWVSIRSIWYGLTEMSSRTAIAPRNEVAKGVPASAARIDRQPPRSTPSARPGWRLSASRQGSSNPGARARSSPSVSSASQRDGPRAICCATIGPWKDTTPAPDQSASRAVRSLPPRSTLGCSRIRSGGMRGRRSRQPYPPRAPKSALTPSSSRQLEEILRPLGGGPGGVPAPLQQIP